MKLLNKHNKECKDSGLIDECLINHCFLRSLEKQARQEIIKEMSLFFVKSNVEIFKQGDPAGGRGGRNFRGRREVIGEKFIIKKAIILEIQLYFMGHIENILLNLQQIAMYG